MNHKQQNIAASQLEVGMEMYHYDRLYNSVGLFKKVSRIRKYNDRLFGRVPPVIQIQVTFDDHTRTTLQESNVVLTRKPI